LLAHTVADSPLDESAIHLALSSGKADLRARAINRQTL
jgi:hypothetical protein